MKRIGLAVFIISVSSAVGGDATLPAKAPSLARFLQSLGPGKIVAVPDGMYSTAGQNSLNGLRGTADQPVVLRAASLGKAVIAGDAGFVLRDCEHVLVEGFVFENDADQQCVRLENCRHVRLTRNVFRPQERENPRHWEHWVTIDGARSGNNRVDHNLFERKTNRGSPLFIRGDDKALVCSQHDRVDHNHFRDVVHANGENGHETIRTGSNDLGASGQSSFTVIEYNLLERCSGEDECISLKSSNNVVRHNTLIDCRGAICMRLGNQNLAEGNIIIAKRNGPDFGGIKLYGFEHRVTGNYFAGLTGTKHKAPFSLFPGMYAAPTTENISDKYDPKTCSAATRCRIDGNTWVDCGPLQIGLQSEDPSRKHLPTGNIFSNNLVVRTKPNPKPIVIAGLVRDLEAKDNTAYDRLAKYDGAWSAWFRWETAMPKLSKPKPLTSNDVGPDAH